jgi:lambda family phage portal protein
MQLTTRIAEKMFQIAGAVPTQGKAPSARKFEAANHSRLNQDFPATSLSADQELRYTLKTMRGRSRYLKQNDAYWVGYCKKLETNVIGEAGLKLQVNAKDASGAPKEVLNRKVEDAWRAWCRAENCDVEGQMDFREFQALAMKTLATDGEVLIRQVNDEGQFKLQFLDIDWLDEDYNEARLDNGNRVVMSVEKTRFGKVVAYWFTEPKYAGFDLTGLKLIPRRTDRLRVPAEQIVHLFVKERPGQSRGIPWTTSIMMTLNQLGGFDDAELVGARIAASNMVIVSPPAEADGGVAAGDISTEVNPGQVLEMPPGYTVHEFNPTKPLDAGFSKRMLRKAAGALGINYNSFTPDLEGVNFSSIRAGEIAERDHWRILQSWLGRYLCQPVFESWLMFQSGLVPATQISQVMYPIWRGRGFDWVDPSKDITADIDAMDRGIKTMEMVLADKGIDFEEHIEQLAYEKKVIEKAGLELVSPSAKLTADTATETAAMKPKPTATGAGK